MSANYNKIATYYDRLAKLVFGSSLETAKNCHLNYIKNGDTILIIGGGTGSILDNLVHLDLSIDYVDLSENMIKKAKNRASGKNNIRFYDADIFLFDCRGYDVIICNFFFDQFPLPRAITLVDLISRKLNPNGLLLVSDFIFSSKMKDKLVVWCMYIFFKFTANLKKVILLDFKIIFNDRRFKQKRSTMITSMIQANIYQKI